MIFYLCIQCLSSRNIREKSKRDRLISALLSVEKKHTFKHIFPSNFFFKKIFFSVYMIATATCTIENWINFRDCRTHNNFNEVKVFKLVLFSLFDKNIQYLVATGISSNEIQMPFGWYRWHCCCRQRSCCCSKKLSLKMKKKLYDNTHTHTHTLITQHNTGNIRLRHKYNM